MKAIELNLRASRTMPFISKTYNMNLVEMATKVMLGVPVRPHEVKALDMEYVGCKVPVFSWPRLRNSDPRLGVEMQSTGEVACFGQPVRGLPQGPCGDELQVANEDHLRLHRAFRR